MGGAEASPGERGGDDRRTCWLASVASVAALAQALSP